MRHKDWCRCVDCVTNTSNTSTDGKLKKMRRIYWRGIRKQLKFKLQNRGRFKGQKFYTRYYGQDEYINIFDYRYHLIRCRNCHNIKKAYMNKRLSCVDCSDNLLKKKFDLYPDWDIWSGRTAS